MHDHEEDAMSGPVTTADAAIEGSEVAAAAEPAEAELEVLQSREARVGPLTVHRALPQRKRRTVGAWCFLDHAPPAERAERAGHAEPGGGIGPHPHIGLQTVTWVLSGEMLHRDSLGSEQVIRPGELNLMTAGHGIVHAEERLGTTPVHIAQLWVAQPAATRNGESAFEHHGELPRVELDSGDGAGARAGADVATVLVGDLAGGRSPARRDTDHFGADIELRSQATIPLRRDHEHVLVPLMGAVELEGRRVASPQLVYLTPGRDEIHLRAPDPARLLLLGGVPFEEPILMWWNYVARTRDEITAAHAEWTARNERFGVPPSPLSPIDVDPPPWAQPPHHPTGAQSDWKS
jgi:quercetin 2,3-dioxygenase